MILMILLFSVRINSRIMILKFCIIMILDLILDHHRIHLRIKGRIMILDLILDHHCLHYCI